jgi:ParB/RepB/Spo0J family partition protein
MMHTTKRAPTNPELLHIPLANISPSASNPRLTLDKEAFKQLKASVLENGLLQPVAVRAAGDNYELVGGHRRYLAVRELAHEHPEDVRFATIAALVVDLSDGKVAAARLAENINRADLNPLEIAEGIADALESGMSEKELAQSLGWKDRNVYRYRELFEAPTWLKAFATEVELPTKRVDESGRPVVDERTEAPVTDVRKLPGLAFAHLGELITLYNLLVEHDAQELQEHGERFKPKAVNTIKKLARAAAKDQWPLTRLRAEVKRIKDPPARTPASRNTAFTITDKRASLNLTRQLARDERDALAPQLTKALQALGFTMVVIGDTA